MSHGSAASATGPSQFRSAITVGDVPVDSGRASPDRCPTELLQTAINLEQPLNAALRRAPAGARRSDRGSDELAQVMSTSWSMPIVKWGGPPVWSFMKHNIAYFPGDRFQCTNTLSPGSTTSA